MAKLKYSIGLVLSLTMMSAGGISILIGIFPADPNTRSNLTIIVSFVLGLILWGIGALVWKWTMRVKNQNLSN